MMNFIEFDKKKCDECYKCLRICPTKSIAFTKDHREIIDARCIKCGKCQAVCEHGALSIQNDKRFVQKAMRSSKRVVASLAPSFASSFQIDNPYKIVTALKKLGFDHVEETGVGAELISQHYEEIISNSQQKHIITSCCSSANYLVEVYYPHLIEAVIPIVSPMIAHGKMIKENDPDAFVVFIGPCLAKKAEAEELNNEIDAVLTFNELDDWFIEDNILLRELEPTMIETPASLRGSAYPLGGSLYQGDLKNRIDERYKYVRVDGITKCKDVLESVTHNALNNYCIEMNICSGSCINGPDLPVSQETYYEKEEKLQNYIATKPTNTIIDIKSKVNVERTFNNKSVKTKKPTKDELNQILSLIGRESLVSQLNCGACGYRSCKEKAEATFNGFADKHMCLPYLREKAESRQSIIFDNSPNLICILDEDLYILEYNPSFGRNLNMTSETLKNMPIMAVLEDDIFKQVNGNRENVVNEKVHFESIEKDFIANIIYCQEEKVIVAILTDVTLREKSREELTRVKEQTILSCQKVIDKQMRVAQEIASLLGETTAETKVNLNKLKNIVLYDEGGL